MKSLVNTLVLFFSVFALITVFTGCDTESADENNVTISPLTATIAEGESITFTASGGFEYRWSIDTEDGNWGALSNLEGPSTVYTSLQNSSSNAAATVRVLTVRSFITGSGSSSNATGSSYSETHTAEAYITHIIDPSAVPTEADALRISPETATTGAGGLVSFTATGGSGTYAWALSSTAYGSISSSAGDTTVYSANSSNVSAQVILTVTSGSENEAAIITHTP